jgi:hypothetical protein
MELMPHQLEAVENLANGRILWGEVGSGKTATALEYYMRNELGRDIYVITTAKKRDSLDWEGEAAEFGIGTVRDATIGGVIKIDSWNNIGKYADIEGEFFIFDEQRLVGSGAWVKSFLKIAKKNNWILLTGTPGDTWMDYVPVFIANGFYKNRTDFKRKHVIYEPFVRYPKIKGYIGERKLELLRNELLVEAPFISHTIRHMNYLPIGYDKFIAGEVWKKRWNFLDHKPCKDAAEAFRLMRRVVNSHSSRLDVIRCLMQMHPRLIIFYNWDYELEILRKLKNEICTLEWNGHKKDPLPEGPEYEWVYLVQYVSGAEGWNCTSTDAMVLYSLTYSYKNFIQALGRIDRLNTPFKDLYYYILVSDAITDRAPKIALDHKKDFNERRYAEELSDELDTLEACELDVTDVLL